MFFYLLKIIAVFLLAQHPSLHSGAHSFLPDQNLTSESDQSSVDCCKMPSLQLLNCWTCLIIKRWKYNPHERCCSSGWSVCVCVCVCECECECVCVCACAARSKTDKQSTLWASGASKRSNTHTICKTDGLESIHLKHSLYLKVNENSWEKIVCQYFVLVTDWSFFNVNQRTKYKDKITHSS